MAQTVENRPAVQETQCHDQEGSLQKGTATHFSILTWRIPWTEEPGGPPSRGPKDSNMTENRVLQPILTGPGQQGGLHRAIGEAGNGGKQEAFRQQHLEWLWPYPLQFLDGLLLCTSTPPLSFSSSPSFFSCSSLLHWVCYIF